MRSGPAVVSGYQADRVTSGSTYRRGLAGKAVMLHQAFLG